MSRLAALGVIALLGLSGCGSGYAGMSKSKAVQQARVQWRVINALAGALADKTANKREHRIETNNPIVTRARCGKKEAWKIEWPPYFPVFVGGGTAGVLFGQSASHCV